MVWPKGGGDAGATDPLLIYKLEWTVELGRTPVSSSWHTNRLLGWAVAPLKDTTHREDVCPPSLSKVGYSMEVRKPEPLGQCPPSTGFSAAPPGDIQS